MFTITKQLKNFSAAHRLINGYQGRCKNLHGHNYALDITFSAKTLNEYGFVIDFDDIKKHFDAWVQNHWDHATIVSEIDKPLIEFLEKEKQDYFLIPGSKNTSAENLAEFLFHQFNKILETLNEPRIQLKNVRVFESETASACFYL
ncbi:MAG: 6-carboxytetrahydropterin synthase [Coxiellaceae bacterium]|nr:6-carboxytetrahydropterin synthase [Coxiellaceae bacterium]